jgi:hypothetical protein
LQVTHSSPKVSMALLSFERTSREKEGRG